MKGNNNQVQKLYKVTENLTLEGKFPGTYYGEHSFNLQQIGSDVPDGKGVFIGKDGWVWISEFVNGTRLKNGKFITIDPI